MYYARGNRRRHAIRVRVVFARHLQYIFYAHKFLNSARVILVAQ